MQYNFSMKIANCAEIQAYLKRCTDHIYDTRLNAFLHMPVSFKDEPQIQAKLKAAGAQEFDEKGPSLFLSAKEWENNPYHKLALPNHSRYGNFTFHMETMEGHRLFNADAIRPDKNRELADWMKLRAMDSDIKALHLYQNKTCWMMNTPAEAATNDPIAEKAHGNVLTFGLGIGYFTFMALRNPTVASVTVVERCQEVINLFKQVILPHFNVQKPVYILHEDAYQMWKPQILKAYDTIYADIWHGGDDGLPIISRLLEAYNPPLEKTFFWIEDSCIEPLRTQIFLHFEELARKITIQPHPAYAIYMQKVRHYFQTISHTVETVEPLKDFLYDRAIARAILSQRI